MPENPQNFKNHTRIDPVHLALAIVALVNLAFAVANANRDLTRANLWIVVLSFTFLIVILKTRINALKVQDRLIRLEETLRMQRVLPSGMQDSIARLRPGQFVALRFASDAELPSLVEKALAENWKGKQIKQAIQNWRPDYFRV